MTTTPHDLDLTSDASVAPLASSRARQEVERWLGDHRDEFLRFVTRRVPANVQPEDLVQQASVRALERAASLRDPDKARAWIYTMLRRLVLDARSNREVPVADVPEPAGHDGVDAPGDDASCACATTLLSRLKPEYREALERVEVGGEPIGSMAADLGISANNATVRVHRARTALREKVEKHCGVTSLAACLDCTCGDHPCGVHGAR